MKEATTANVASYRMITDDQTGHPVLQVTVWRHPANEFHGAPPESADLPVDLRKALIDWAKGDLTP